MNHPKLTFVRRALAKKLAVFALIAVSAIASFATLGDGNKKSGPKGSLLSSRNIHSGSFTLRSGYTFRGNQVISPEVNKQRIINLNTTVTYQKGNTTFILPLKKKMILSNIKIDIGNRQFQRN